MKIKRIGKIGYGQDGAIYAQYLFRFDPTGVGSVYDLRGIDEESSPIGIFSLDPSGKLIPCASSVAFGTEYAESDDEFPALYVNVYNNYAKNDEPLKGATCVYRILRDDDGLFSASLIQLIEIDFTDDATLWETCETIDGPRPSFGNFAIDGEYSRYYASVTHNEMLGTRYFAFDLPALADGEYDENIDALHLHLSANDILHYFDCPYQRFLRGTALKNGKIYSLEGLALDPATPSAIRIIDLAQQREECYVSLADHGVTGEPKMIGFSGDICYFGDNTDALYTIDLNLP